METFPGNKEMDGSGMKNVKRQAVQHEFPDTEEDRPLSKSDSNPVLSENGGIEEDDVVQEERDKINADELNEIKKSGQNKTQANTPAEANYVESENSSKKAELQPKRPYKELVPVEFDTDNNTAEKHPDCKKMPTQNTCEATVTESQPVKLDALCRANERKHDAVPAKPSTDSNSSQQLFDKQTFDQHLANNDSVNQNNTVNSRDANHEVSDLAEFSYTEVRRRPGSSSKGSSPRACEQTDDELSDEQNVLGDERPCENTNAPPHFPSGDEQNHIINNGGSCGREDAAFAAENAAARPRPQFFRSLSNRGIASSSLLPQEITWSSENDSADSASEISHWTLGRKQSNSRFKKKACFPQRWSPRESMFPAALVSKRKHVSRSADLQKKACFPQRWSPREKLDVEARRNLKYTKRRPLRPRSTLGCSISSSSSSSEDEDSDSIRPFQNEKHDYCKQEKSTHTHPNYRFVNRFKRSSQQSDTKTSSSCSLENRNPDDNCDQETANAQEGKRKVACEVDKNVDRKPINVAAPAAGTASESATRAPVDGATRDDVEPSETSCSFHTGQPVGTCSRDTERQNPREAQTTSNQNSEVVSQQIEMVGEDTNQQVTAEQSTSSTETGQSLQSISDSLTTAYDGAQPLEDILLVASDRLAATAAERTRSVPQSDASPALQDSGVHVSSRTAQQPTGTTTSASLAACDVTAASSPPTTGASQLPHVVSPQPEADGPALAASTDTTDNETPSDPDRPPPRTEIVTTHYSNSGQEPQPTPPRRVTSRELLIVDTVCMRPARRRGARGPEVMQRILEASVSQLYADNADSPAVDLMGCFVDMRCRLDRERDVTREILSVDRLQLAGEVQRNEEASSPPREAPIEELRRQFRAHLSAGGQLSDCRSCGTQRANCVLLNCHCLVCCTCARHHHFCPLCLGPVLTFIRID